MSRGRGRGRGRGGSTAGRDQFNAAFAGMSKEDSRAVLESFSKPVKGSGMLYPPLDKAAELPGPTGLEDRVIFHTNTLLRDLAEGLEDAEGGRHGAPWRLESERKVVGIEIESYSDRYRRANTNAAVGNSQLDAGVLHLNRDLFPPSLWTEYFEGNTGAEKKARAIARANRRRRALDDDDDEGDGEPSEGEEDEDDFDFDDEDEEDHQDYDHNYFDNGEGDDDSGGEGGDDEGGRYDD
ncbi:hypothetical protein CspeluHIS016_0101110 [Cutaneotrichosporon spelunceum]|uniref:DNA-directed RNA polymerase III subunit n=1 Tax=Cutaneotrichosporon spelunceum TaxID=1672016 RepID=A0AAD3Y7A8_9TREE|nr:hypothetical protein CspeluHIS016_0101110 [Cutaneotrichosporon spelunceum]